MNTEIQTILDSPLTYMMAKEVAEYVMSQPAGQLELPVAHYHVEATPNSRVGGVYARELFLPAGTFAVGAIHKYPQLNIMSFGLIDIATQEGIKRIRGPYTVSSPAGTQRIVYALEDTLWTCISGIDEKDEEVLWDTLYTLDFNKYLEFADEQKKLIGEKL